MYIVVNFSSLSFIFAGHKISYQTSGFNMMMPQPLPSTSASNAYIPPKTPQNEPTVIDEIDASPISPIEQPNIDVNDEALENIDNISDAEENNEPESAPAENVDKMSEQGPAAVRTEAEFHALFENFRKRREK